MFKKFIEYLANHKDFTNQLRNRLNNDFEDDPGQTIGYYEKNYVKKWIILKVFYNTLI